jgi:hypothetical protein
MEMVIAGAISVALKSRDQIAAELITHASQFTWDKTANLTLKVYKHVLSL